LVAGAGLSLTKAATEANDRGLAGLHPLGGIPAQIGGAVAMNAGGRHGWISDVLVSATVALPDGTLATLAAADLHFGYRHCELPPGALVVEAVFELAPDDPARLKRVYAEIVKTKNAAQPTRGANFGCTWKNPGGQEGSSRAELVARFGRGGSTRPSKGGSVPGNWSISRA
jgi:UDP-N-acetylmuramate dehydrogenase